LIDKMPAQQSQPQPQPPRDTIVEAILEKFKARSALGWTKYGTTLDREDLGVLDWIVHAQEELMDGILYLEKLKKVVGSGGAGSDVRYKCEKSACGCSADSVVVAATITSSSATTCDAAACGAATATATATATAPTATPPS
jgi:hypothetical protein